MDHSELLNLIQSKYGIAPLSVEERYSDEVHIKAAAESYCKICLALHLELVSPVISMFAQEMENDFRIYVCFLGKRYRKWFIVSLDIPKSSPKLDSIAKKIYSANLFEREIKEMFGIEIVGNPDNRSIRIHDEVWPRGYYPLRKDFTSPIKIEGLSDYKFLKVEGEGIFEVPVGPVHAGIIPPGHFRFSVAGEPIINLEIRLGFKHKGIEKLMEQKSLYDALRLSECVAGDSSVAHGTAFCNAIEKISACDVPLRALQIRAVILELERMYSHMASIAGISLDVGYSHSAALASIVKENIHQLNDDISGSRFLRGILAVGGLLKDMNNNDIELIKRTIAQALRDLAAMKKEMLTSASFMDRVDTTGYLSKKTAEDIGVLGVAGRASGVDVDLRRDMPSVLDGYGLKISLSQAGDVLGRLSIRIDEIEVSAKIIGNLLDNLAKGDVISKDTQIKEGHALGYAEGWRGPVLYWLATNKEGGIDRCKIVDPSFHNWQGLSYAVLENIIPDFPVCNKSFDLSYEGSDL
jgi:Ni,Fe-hydrogenase III large subunit/Ni,Fe-hydrogenase III component G